MTALTQWRSVLSRPESRKAYRNYVEDWETRIGSFLEFDPDRLAGEPDRADEDGPLDGVPFGVKDNIAVRHFKLTCGSKILENLVSPYTATAVEKLRAAGALPVGKTNMDEFGMGSSNEYSALGRTANPWDPDRVAGGSSGGSAAAVAAGLVPFALGSDTGGSVRQPAAFCGVYGLKPTYGTVSRYGLTAYASSLEVIGALARDIATLRAVYDAMKGADPRDHSSLPPGPEDAGRPRRVGLLHFEGDDLEPEVVRAGEAFADRLREAGYEIEPVSLDTLDLMVPVYYTIATAEASANLARYNGIRYGLAPDFAENPIELTRKARSAGFGDEVKLRILLGTFVLRSGFQDQYYVRAQKLRTAIRRDFDRLFKDVDLLALPAYPVRAFRHGEAGLDSFQQKKADVYTCAANLAGLPALTVPAAVEGGLPVGFQLMGPAFAEASLFTAAADLENLYPTPAPPGFRAAPDFSGKGDD